MGIKELREGPLWDTVIMKHAQFGNGHSGNGHSGIIPSASPNIDFRQSAYMKHHSPEISLLKVYEDLYKINDAGSAALLVSLDISAAFDFFFEHFYNILLNRLHEDFGIGCIALDRVIPHMQNADGLCWLRNRRRYSLRMRSATG